MLEDPSISHLISWTPANDSFIITPGEEFSKVLSQYFKHTNVSSFVRQLNMYGFHKVNDTFHGTMSNNSQNSLPPDNAQWEFKHGAGAFKRGDVESLRAIKRRASRQSVMHKENVSLKSVSLSVPSTPINEFPPTSTVAVAAAVNVVSTPPIPGLPTIPTYSEQLSNMLNSHEARIASLEQTAYMLQDTNIKLQSSCAVVVDTIKRTQIDAMRLIDIISKFRGDRKDEKDSSIYAELEKVKNDFHYRELVLAQLEEQEQQMYQQQQQQQQQQSRSQSQQQAPQPFQTQLFQPQANGQRRQSHVQPPAKNQQNQPNYYAYPYPSHTKPDISFSSSRDRAASVFYDPLASLPHANSANPMDEHKQIPTSSPSNYRPALPPSSAPTTQPPTGQPQTTSLSSPSSPSQVQFHQPFSSPHQQQGYFAGYQPEPPSREKRPGSFPFLSQRPVHHGQRSNTVNGPVYPPFVQNPMHCGIPPLRTDPHAFRSRSMPGDGVILPGIAASTPISSRHNSSVSSSSSAERTATTTNTTPSTSISNGSTKNVSGSPYSPHQSNSRHGSSVQSLLNPTSTNQEDEDRINKKRKMEEEK